MDQNPNLEEKEEEKLEFLKREEIRTMAKDVAELREEEAQKERERIADIAPEISPPTGLPIASKEKPLVPARPTPQPQSKEEKPLVPARPINIIPPPLKKSLSVRKILVRAVVILTVICLIVFFYWLFTAMKNRSPEKPIIPSSPETPTIKEETTIEEKIKEETETPVIPLIIERIVDWGYHLPSATRTIDTVIIHSTHNTLGGDPYDAEKVIQEHQIYKVAAHLLINREGAVYRLVPDEAVAYHAGTGIMPDGSRKNIINDFSIGIELVYAKTESPNEAQYQSLVQIVKYLKQKYDIVSKNILAANQISPGRKDDPWNFDWEKLNQLMGITENIPEENPTVSPGKEASSQPESEKPVVQKCADGTMYNQCSTDKPKYCDGGALIEKASLCGCPENFRVLGDACELLENTNDIIILEEENAGEILSPPQIQDARWHINAENFLKQFYQTRKDDYDFIVLFPTKTINNHNSVMITTDDIGGTGNKTTVLSSYANYTKKLKSIAELNYHFIWEDPWFNKQQLEADETLVQTMMHEMAHHWCCFISGWPGEGEYSGMIHWPGNLDLFYGDARYLDIMGYGQWIRDNEKDVCVGQTDITQWKFSKLTQYLMGLIPKEQVAPIYLYEPEEDPNYHTCGKYATVNAYTITIEDVIKINGPKIPSYENSQKSFRVAFVIVTPKNEEAEQKFIDYVNLYKQALPDAWEKATDGNSHIIY